MVYRVIDNNGMPECETTVNVYHYSALLKSLIVKQSCTN